MATVLDCAHTADDWAEERATGIRRCIPCDTAHAARVMASANDYRVRLDLKLGTVTTGRGGTLGTITMLSTGRRGMRYVRVTDAHGGIWRGCASDKVSTVTLFRVKGK